MSVARHSLEQLHAKYNEMLSMRLAHESGDEDQATVRNRMAELASRFPGALREMDDLELDVIRDRMARLERVLRGDRPIELWMEAVTLFHALARGALWAKRWLGGRKAVDSSVRGKYESDASSAGVGGEALVWADELADIAAPPRGRVMDLVFARIAGRLGTTEDEARALVFGSPRSPRLRIVR